MLAEKTLLIHGGEANYPHLMPEGALQAFEPPVIHALEKLLRTVVLANALKDAYLKDIANGWSLDEQSTPGSHEDFSYYTRKFGQEVLSRLVWADQQNFSDLVGKISRFQLQATEFKIISSFFRNTRDYVWLSCRNRS